MKQVLLYSKYSQSCMQLLSTMERLGANISMVCLDNQEVRKRVMNDSRLKITVVPTLLSLYDSGVVEKYEGQKVLELLLQAFEGVTRRETSSSKVELTTLEEEEEPTTEERVELPQLQSEEAPNFADRMTRKKAKQEQPRKVENKEEQRTNILDLDAADDRTEPISTPRSSQDTDGENDTSTDGRQDTSQNLPIKASSGISSLAAQMAKEREQHQANLPRGENNIRPSN